MSAPDFTVPIKHMMMSSDKWSNLVFPDHSRITWFQRKIPQIGDHMVTTHYRQLNRHYSRKVSVVLDPWFCVESALLLNLFEDRFSKALKMVPIMLWLMRYRGAIFIPCPVNTIHAGFQIELIRIPGEDIDIWCETSTTLLT